MSPKNYFLLYAFPCTHIRFSRGEIGQAIFDMLREKTIKKEDIAEKLLEQVYPTAVAEIERIAKRERSEKWSLKVIQTYFLKEHTEYIDQRKGTYEKAPEALCEFCKVVIGEIIKETPEGYLAKTQKGLRPLTNEILRGAKKGDKVTIHHGYAVENLSDKETPAYIWFQEHEAI